MPVIQLGAGGTKRGLVRVRSQKSYDDTITDLEHEITRRGLVLYGVVDHSGDAAYAGMSLQPARVVTFGDPRVLTPLLLGTPSLALDLPPRVLVRQDEKGRVWLMYASLAHLARSHGLDPEALGSLHRMLSVVDAVSDSASESVSTPPARLGSG